MLIYIYSIYLTYFILSHSLSVKLEVDHLKRDKNVEEEEKEKEKKIKIKPTTLFLNIMMVNFCKQKCNRSRFQSNINVVYHITSIPDAGIVPKSIKSLVQTNIDDPVLTDIHPMVFSACYGTQVK